MEPRPVFVSPAPPGQWADKRDCRRTKITRSDTLLRTAIRVACVHLWLSAELLRKPLPCGIREKQQVTEIQSGVKPCGYP